MRSRDISPVELMKETLEKAHEADSKYSAFISIADDLAMTEAASAERAYRAADAPPCAGLPFPVKDTEPVTGMPTTYGSAIFRNHYVEEDGAAARRIRQSGAIIFAKTNTPAFAHKDETENLLRPPARNPRKSTHSPGGSSGGAAVAVAAGVCSVAHATDGSGSARIPASLCGVVGFKPTYGRIAMWPVVDVWAARSHQGVIGRSVEDVALGMSVLVGHDEFDPLSLTSEIDWRETRPSDDLRRSQGIYVSSLGPDETDPEVEKICSHAVSLMRNDGWRIESQEMELASTYDWYCALWRPQFVKSMARHIAERPELVDNSVKAVCEIGSRITLDEHLDARASRTRFHNEMVERLRDVSYLMTPTLPCAAWPLGAEPVIAVGKPAAHPIPGGRWESLYMFNVLGWPAITVPCGQTADGRPVGIQIVTKREKDAECLQLAWALERSLQKTNSSVPVKQ